MNTFVETLKYFLVITAELVALFLLISMFVELLLMYIPQEKMRKKLSGKGISGNVVASFFGALTPFCACSTIPVTVGFLQAGVPFGSIMSFLIASPLLNPIIIGMLGAMVGVKAAIIYFIVAFACAVFFGYVLEKAGAAKYVKNIRLKNNAGTETIKLRSLTFGEKLKRSFSGAWEGMRPMLPYLFAGVAIGAAIYGYLPEDFVLKTAGSDNLLAVPFAAVLGVPLYIRAETAIPIGLALLDKGMGLGAVIALIIGGAGIAIPEMSMLAGIFKKKMVGIIVLVIFLTAVTTGYIFNFFV